MPSKHCKPVVGIVGGIGSGKSFVSSMLAKLGAKVIVGDQLGHEALSLPSTKNKLVERWGQGILDAQGEIDRKIVGSIVFGDAKEKSFLENTVFPHIEKRIIEEINQAKVKPNQKFIVLDAAILLETGWGKACDIVVYVHSNLSQRLRRIMQSRDWQVEEFRRRTLTQMPLAEKAAIADYIIDNSSSIDHLSGEVERFVNWLKLNYPASFYPNISMA